MHSKLLKKQKTLCTLNYQVNTYLFKNYYLCSFNLFIGTRYFSDCWKQLEIWILNINWYTLYISLKKIVLLLIKISVRSKIISVKTTVHKCTLRDTMRYVFIFTRLVIGVKREAYTNYKRKQYIKRFLKTFRSPFDKKRRNLI